MPFTVKIRSGWDSKSANYLEIGRIAEECGVDAITLHPRTAAQEFGGSSDWSHIAKLKKALKIPVIGNGDIKTPEDAMRMLDETRCNGIMIGRGSPREPLDIQQDTEVYGRRGSTETAGRKGDTLNH